jgi:hypothetical protein
MAPAIPNMSLGVGQGGIIMITVRSDPRERRPGGGEGRSGVEWQGGGRRVEGSGAGNSAMPGHWDGLDAWRCRVRYPTSVRSGRAKRAEPSSQGGGEREGG